MFGKAAGNDVIVDLDVANDRLLFDGTAIRSSEAKDWNGDGIADIRLTLTGGGSVTLLGLSSLAGVQTGPFSEASQAQQGLHYEANDGSTAMQALLKADLWLIA